MASWLLLASPQLTSERIQAVGGVEGGQGAGAPPYSSLGEQDCSGGVGELAAQAGLDGHLVCNSMMKMKIRRSLLPRLAWMVTTHSPTPLTGLMVILVPCLNSSLEFIRVSGLRCEIRTPSLAFLLCGLTNTPVLLMLKCSKIEITSLPSCLSRICFQRGLSAALLWASAT